MLTPHHLPHDTEAMSAHVVSAHAVSAHAVGAHVMLVQSGGASNHDGCINSACSVHMACCVCIYVWATNLIVYEVVMTFVTESALLQELGDRDQPLP